MRDYKKEYREYHSSKTQKLRRAMRNKANRKLKPGPGKEVDHKTPLSAGGSNSESNWRVVSKSTNRKKYNKTADLKGYLYDNAGTLIGAPIGTALGYNYGEEPSLLNAVAGTSLGAGFGLGIDMLRREGLDFFRKRPAELLSSKALSTAGGVAGGLPGAAVGAVVGTNIGSSIDSSLQKKASSEERKIRPRVALWLHDGKGNLLVQDDRHRGLGFKFPSGGIDPGQSINEAARREALEEVGYSLAESPRAIPGIRAVNVKWDPVFLAEAAKKGRNFWGSRHYHRIALAGGEDRSLLGSEGDALNASWVPADVLLKETRNAAKDPNNKYNYFDRERLRVAEVVAKLLRERQKTASNSKDILIPPPPSEEALVRELPLIESQYKNRYNPKHLQPVLDSDMSKVLDAVITSSGLESEYDKIYQYTQEIRPSIKKHKKHFDLDRPNVLAKSKGLHLSFDHLDSAQTPSYPSGHTAQAYYAAYKMAEEHPELSAGLLEAANMISQSRVDRGVHYPSDISAGILLAKALYSKEIMDKEASEDFKPDFTPKQLKEMGVYDEVYGDKPSKASMKEWPEHWINKQDPLGWLQWYERYSDGRRTEDDSRQIKRWKSFKARHLAQYKNKPTERREAALRNWGIDVKEANYNGPLEVFLKLSEKGVAKKTNPAKWEAAKREAKAKMGGKHSARAMQLATQIYKKKGGGYSGKKPSAKSNKLKKWTKQDWQWSGDRKKKAALDNLAEKIAKSKGVYLPAKAIDAYKSSDKGKAKLRAAVKKKTEATKKGKQFSSHGLHKGKKRSEV